MITAYTEGWTEYVADFAGLNIMGWSLHKMIEFMRPYMLDFTEERLVSQMMRISMSRPGFTFTYE